MFQLQLPPPANWHNAALLLCLQCLRPMSQPFSPVPVSLTLVLPQVQLSCTEVGTCHGLGRVEQPPCGWHRMGTLLWGAPWARSLAHVLHQPCNATGGEKPFWASGISALGHMCPGSPKCLGLIPWECSPGAAGSCPEPKLVPPLPLFRLELWESAQKPPSQQEFECRGGHRAGVLWGGDQGRSPLPSLLWQIQKTWLLLKAVFQELLVGVAGPLFLVVQVLLSLCPGPVGDMPQGLASLPHGSPGAARGGRAAEATVPQVCLDGHGRAVHLSAWVLA